jgi:hypothetical protein
MAARRDAMGELKSPRRKKVPVRWTRWFIGIGLVLCATVLAACNSQDAATAVKDSVHDLSDGQLEQIAHEDHDSLGSLRLTQSQFNIQLQNDIDGASDGLSADDVTEAVRGACEMRDDLQFVAYPDDRLSYVESKLSQTQQVSQAIVTLGEDMNDARTNQSPTAGVLKTAIDATCFAS